MRGWAGIVLAVLAGGMLFFVAENDDVAGEPTFFETVGVDPPKRSRS